MRVQAQPITGAGRVVSPPKSEAGLRRVSIPTVVVEALEKHLASYGQPGEAGALFTGPRGNPITRSCLSKDWQAARTAVNAPEGLRIHDLRHHAATLTARMPGITTKELMGRIGHSSPRAALIYQHATRNETVPSPTSSTSQSSRSRTTVSYAEGVSDAVRRSKHDLPPEDRERLEAAHRELRDAVAGYERFLGGPLEPGQALPVHDAREVEAAQERVAAAEDRLWQLREELLGWARPPWAPSAALVSDWFSDEDSVYDDLPETTAS